MWYASAYVQLADRTRLLDLPNEVRIYGVPVTSSIGDHVLACAARQHRKAKKKSAVGRPESVHRDSINQNVGWKYKIGRAWISHADLLI
jgi:hypothetical protein